MKSDFLKLKDHNDVAKFFGLNYHALAKILYRTPIQYKYKPFSIPKKDGGERLILAPSKKLKAIQERLKDVLYEIYEAKPSTHGFARNRSIVSNAEMHLDKKFIFNIDLIDFFGAIFFQRVRNLFKAKPFNFNNTVSTIIAQICCFQHSLPQGAPTSPIISNMIAWKLDSQLQFLAKGKNCTYTRYADDISFSFTCNKYRLPPEIVIFFDGKAMPGHLLTQIIEKNGFRINYSKVRIRSTLSRMEITGLTVNEFPNVKRQYVRQLTSMIYAWEKYGYKLAEKDYNEVYSNKHRASGKPKSFLHVVMGKLAFLRSVRGRRDPIFNKLAKRFNEQVDDKLKFKISEITDPEQNAINSLWVIEACYDEKGETKTTQGTGFQFEDAGIVSCSHVVLDEEGIPFQNLEVYKYTAPSDRYKIQVAKICPDRDIAICHFASKKGISPPEEKIVKSTEPITTKQPVILLGFPYFAPGNTHYIQEAKIGSLFPESGVQKFEIDALIRTGNSGGPIINADSKVIGIAQKGTRNGTGRNACINIAEMGKVITDKEFNIENYLKKIDS